jgi:putative membrane protein
MNGNFERPSKATVTATDLALERTQLAYERTLMAWVRTATSLISFGFTIYKFFEGLRESGELKTRGHLLGSRNFALIMISIGLVTLILATFQHHQGVKRLNQQLGTKSRSLALVLAALISFLGVLGLLAVVFRQ